MEDKDEYLFYDINKLSIEYLKKQFNTVIENLLYLDFVIDIHKLSNEQFVLDFYDKLNEISVKK